MDLLVEGLDYLVSVTKQLLMTAKTLLMTAKELHQGTGQGTTNVPRQELLTLLMCRVSELIAVAS